MRYVATGRVHPERADVRFSPIQLKTQDGGGVSISCDSSQVTVVIDSVPAVDGFVSAFIMAKSMATMVTTALGFSLGTGYSVEVIQVLEEDGKSHVLGTRPGNLHFEPSLPVFGSAFQASAKDIFLRYALQDYVRALSGQDECAFLCYRSIEAIASSFDTRDKGRGWAAMHAALGTQRTEVDSVVKDFADPIRHGNWTSMRTTTSAQRNAMLVLTRDLLNKYLTWAAALPNQALNPPGAGAPAG